MDSNWGSVVSESTALPTDPQPVKYFLYFRPRFSFFVFQIKYDTRIGDMDLKFVFFPVTSCHGGKPLGLLETCMLEGPRAFVTPIKTTSVCVRDWTIYKWANPGLAVTTVLIET